MLRHILKPSCERDYGNFNWAILVKNTSNKVRFGGGLTMRYNIFTDTLDKGFYWLESKYNNQA